MRHFASLLASVCALAGIVAAMPAMAACPAGDDLDIQLRDKELQRHLILSGALGAEIGRANEKMLRTAVADFRTANALPGTDQDLLTEAECDTLKHNNDAVYAFIGFKQVVNPVNNLKMTFPAGLLPPEAKPSNLSWQEYENPAVSRIGIDVFRVSGRESSNSSFARGYQSYGALTLTFVHNSGSEMIAEGAGNRWGSRYYFHNLNFEYQGGQRGIYLRFDMRPPANFIPPPEILAAARLEKSKKAVTKLFTGGVAGATPPNENEIAWALIARAVFNIVASDFYDQNGWRELTTQNCVFGSARRARRGGVRIVFATTRAMVDREGDMSTMFGNAPSDKITFGCVQVNPRISRGDSSYRGAWRGAARAANARIKLLEDPIDRTNENYIRIIDTSASEDATHALLVIHGYNNSFQEAMQAAARIAGGADYKGRVYMFSWPSVRMSLRYLQDADNAEEAEGALQAFLAAILRDNNVRTLDVVAHSMGSQQLMRVMGSIREILDSRRHDEGMLRLGQVVFAAPDVSAAVFNTKILTWAKLAQRVTIYTSGGDWVLWLSSFLRGFNDRAGGHTPWGDPLHVNASNVYVVDKTPPEYDFWKFFTYTHADYVDDKTILNDIQTVITGKPSGDPSKRDPDGKVFRATPYAGMNNKKYWETLPEGPIAEAKDAVEGAKEAVKDAVKPAGAETPPPTIPKFAPQPSEPMAGPAPSPTPPTATGATR
ncbi:Alpha/beta hydrolase [Hyphomicrobium sp. 1Nfss2.1]|uniref:alpha/beta hydrolase n=1 Tax=Hyphomicrobium sp. 1Nfss2.1 TaxID=3413936 RepID=UPI003C7A42B5